MANSQIIAYGATVERSTDGVAWTAIPGCKGIAIPAPSTDYIDATSLDSPNGFKEYIRGMRDAGEISVPCGYTAAGYEQQIADSLRDEPVFTAPPQTRPGQKTGDVFQFRGFPTPQVEGNDVTGLIAMTISIRATGNVTWTKGTKA
ncbi:hypothetical protein [Rhodobacter capsulatus]|uniref:hypothetical protein n=1 Tax=Rhodobacter capsulatus TaxID=1061 RepID=UPI0040261AAE